MSHSNRYGFTLVELSIVLIIIGLLTAGILVGKDLIRAAEVRSQVTQIEKFNTATNTFKLKYNCLPGDCDTAESVGLGVAGGPGANGNGNGMINVSRVGTIIVSSEGLNFWYHLSQANLIADDMPGYSNWTQTPGTATPALKLASSSSNTSFANPRGGVTILPLNVDDATFGLVNLEPLFNINSRAKTVWWFTTTFNYLGLSGVYLPNNAMALDSKMDDGMPRGGNMRSFTHTPTTWHSLGETLTPNCIDFSVTPPQYNYTSTNTTAPAALCSPMILTQF